MDDEHFHGEGGKITLDVCLTCHGVWLDAGELDAIAKLNDKAFDSLTPEKRAELLDQDMAFRRDLRGKNIFAQLIGNFVHGVRIGTRRLR
jgi:Zn-finger nucleic acid-binding protein